MRLNEHAPQHSSTENNAFRQKQESSVRDIKTLEERVCVE